MLSGGKFFNVLEKFLKLEKKKMSFFFFNKEEVLKFFPRSFLFNRDVFH